jgi:hypothetical protein
VLLGQFLHCKNSIYICLKDKIFMVLSLGRVLGSKIQFCITENVVNQSNYLGWETIIVSNKSQEKCSYLTLHTLSWRFILKKESGQSEINCMHIDFS